jgi:hypothetical protein
MVDEEEDKNAKIFSNFVKPKKTSFLCRMTKNEIEE